MMKVNVLKSASLGLSSGVTKFFAEGEQEVTKEELADLKKSGLAEDVKPAPKTEKK